jgi:hypothetical protein
MPDDFFYDAEDISSNSKIGMSQEEFNEAVDQIQDDIMDDDYEIEIEEGWAKPNVRSIVRGMRSKLEQNFSQVCVLSSLKQNGFGKSSLSYWFQRENGAGQDIFSRNFFYRGTKDDLVAKTDSLHKKEFLTLDEMVRLWYKRRAMSKDSVDLNEWMGADQRKTNVGLLACIPDFWDLDAYARDGKANIYVEIFDRGVGLVFKPDYYIRSNPWRPDAFDNLQKRRSHIGSKERLWQKVKTLRRHPCFDSVVLWTKMPKYDEMIYLKHVKQAADTKNTEDLDNDVDIAIKKVNEKHMKAHKKSWRAIVNLTELLQLRGVKEAVILREAGLDRQTFTKMKRALSNDRHSII